VDMMNLMRRVFRLLNKFFMVPLFRLGMGPFIGNPITGYIMVIKNVGRKTGKIRYTPVNYAIRDGYVYCMAGFGKVTHWYKNLKANPSAELILPSGPIAVFMDEVSDQDEVVAISQQLLINTGLAAMLEGLVPFKRVPEDRIINTLVKRGVPLLRFRPTGVGSGASDPSGWLWITMTALTLLVLYFLLR